MEEEFLTLVKYLKEIEFKVIPLYQICDKKYTKQSKLKATLETSTFQTLEMEIFKSNRSFCVFYPTLRETFFRLKMIKRNEKNFKIPKIEILKSNRQWSVC